METSTKDLFHELLDKFNSLDREDITAINNFLNEYSKYFERNIFDSVSYNDCTGREYLNGEIIDLLNTKKGNFTIGDLIIEDCLVNNKKINGLVFYYDSLRCLNDLNINKYIDITIDFREDEYYIDKDNIRISLGDKNLYRDFDITNLLKVRKIIKEYDQLYNRDNKNNLENLYFEISNYLKKLDIPSNLEDFIPNKFDVDLYSYKTLNDLIKSFENSNLDNYVDELTVLSRIRDVNSEDYFIILNGLNYDGINEDILGKDYFDRYLANSIDNCTLEQNGYDKANLLPFIYTLIDYYSMGLLNGYIEDNWDNYKNLYEVIIRSQKVLNEFPEYKALIKENRYDFDEKLKIQFIPYKLFDIYNYNNNLVYEWANTNYIDKFEYNSDYYKGDMKSELDTMYLRDYLNRNKINNKKI